MSIENLPVHVFWSIHEQQEQLFAHQSSILGIFRQRILLKSQVLGGDGGGFVATKYYYLNGQRVAKSVDGVVTWIHSDHLHSATILTDEDGREIRRLAYAAFGEELENTGSGAGPTYSYTGKERDRSGLMYYGARYYDPALSRFITADTVYDRGPQGLNRYAYALNNPIRYNDPSGHFSLGSMFGNWNWPGAELVGAKMQAEAQGAAEGAVEGAVLVGTVALTAISASPDDVVVEVAQYAADKSGNKTLSKAVMIGGLFFSIDDVASPRTWKKWKKARETVADAVKGIDNIEEAADQSSSLYKRSKFRKKARQEAVEQAPVDESGDLICPTCGESIPDEIVQETRNGPRTRVGYDLDHYPDTWAERVAEMKSRETSPTRKEVLDEFNRDLRVQCPECNQGHQWEGVPGPYEKSE